MSLRWKMTVQIAAMIVGLLLVSAAALWGVNGLHQDFGLALSKIQELRQIYGQVGSHLVTARTFLPERQRAANELELASRKFDLFLLENPPAPGEGPRDAAADAQMRQSILNAMTELRSAPNGRSEAEVELADQNAVNEALVQMRSVSTRIHEAILARQDAANLKWRDTYIAVGVLCACVIVIAVLIGVVQYRSVMTPLKRLMSGVRDLAAGQFQHRLRERGAQEFVQLSDEFNRMAAELDEFYHRLEQKVADKSRELIRSERLASVGYLAAGVAHEINNPLGIIAGYAEYSLSQLKTKSAPHSSDDLEQSLQTISDEAFRCKDIIGKLLSLARPGEAQRTPVDLGAVAADVASTVGRLRDYRDRQLMVAADSRQSLVIQAVEAEMKQVVLNLTLNALEAVSPGGQVRIEVGASNGSVELRVCDNGRGMSSQVLERVFEPFFTDKRGARQPGTGLGLSISHAIIESHGGTIRAYSDGPGKGSEFVVRLPAHAQQKPEGVVQRSVA